MKLTKGIISRAEAVKISPIYVAYVEGDFNAWPSIVTPFDQLKRGQKAITYCDGIFVQVKVTSINRNDYKAIDGPVVRVSNGEYSWRVDGDHYAFPVCGQLKG